MSYSYLSAEQVAQLLQPINEARVLSRDGLSYVAQHDIRAHLTRIFGFGNWSMRVIDTQQLFEYETTTSRGKPAWKVGYRATVGLDIRDATGNWLATYEDSAADENAPLPDRGQAHHMALTTAVSTAMKRAATSLGDQFGLSLYERGSTLPFVRGTLIRSQVAPTDVAVSADGSEISAPASPPGDGDDTPEGEVPAETVRDDETPQESTPRPSGVVVDEDESPGWFWMKALRELAVEADNEARTTGVAALVTTAGSGLLGPGFLDQVVVVQGTQMTRARLAEMVRLGSFLSGATSG